MNQLDSMNTDCVDDDEQQTQVLSHATGLMNNNVWAYHNPQYDIFHPSRASSDSTFLQGSGSHDAYTYQGAAFPLPPRQFTNFSQVGFSQSVPAPHYFPRSHVNVHPFLPFYGVSEPQMMFSRGLDYSMTRPVPRSVEFEMPAPMYSPDSISPTATSPSLSFMSSPEQSYPYTAWFPGRPSLQEDVKMVRVRDDSHEDDRPFDKPYAQLIYDALMQAPGHRMLLRDIYDWFVDNTKKPRESGTNGWQNSIRHNLSMNQAFEHDKNDPAASRGARKANSVWVLTEHAIKHGVQSTTRFRKNHLSKRGAVSKTSSAKRRRSGARGGRATRRAGRSKRTIDDSDKVKTNQIQPDTIVPLDSIDHIMPERRDQWANYGSYSPYNSYSPYDPYSPNTPQADHLLNFTYNLPQNPHCQMGEADIKYEAGVFLDDEEQLRRILSQADSEDMFEEHYNVMMNK